MKTRRNVYNLHKMNSFLIKTLGYKNSLNNYMLVLWQVINKLCSFKMNYFSEIMDYYNGQFITSMVGITFLYNKEYKLRK